MSSTADLTGSLLDLCSRTLRLRWPAILVNAVVDASIKAREGLQANPMAAIDVRPVTRAVTPVRPIRDARPMARASILIGWLGLTFTLFAGIEAWSGPKGQPGFEV